ncbi:DNA polymerase III subunit delta [Paenibacillus ginsengihumi]|uniref:DNA polymerase III subunit delta n=1 Tax=Paenibacillus ginsengihumi TaxID=431596 RepID=UPI00036BFE74|nr:DNA polymerase III subunit delta [Paenibacillus ginsengihumi]
MDYRTAIKRIDKGEFAPLYVCYGAETYLIRGMIEKLTNRIVNPDDRTLAVSRFDLSETPLDALLDEAETLPFMVPRKLVIGTNASFLTGAKDSGKIEHRLDRLAAYMSSPAEFTVIVLTVEADKLDERKKLVKKLKELDALVPCAQLSEAELVRWIEQQAAQAGFALAPGVAERLILYAGAGLQGLSKELEKCALYAGQGGTLTEEALEQLVTRTIEQNIFALIEHIVQLRMEQAFTMLSELLRRKEEPIKIVMLIARQFRIMFQVKDLSQQGYSQQQIASQLGLHPYAVKVAAGQAGRFDARRLAAILQQLADLDYQMKSGKIDKVLGLELFLLRLAA